MQTLTKSSVKSSVEDYRRMRNLGILDHHQADG